MATSDLRQDPARQLSFWYVTRREHSGRPSDHFHSGFNPSLVPPLLAQLPAGLVQDDPNSGAPSSEADTSSLNKPHVSPPGTSNSGTRPNLGANQLSASENTFDPNRLNSNQDNFDPNSMLQLYLGNSTDANVWNQMPGSSGSFNVLAQSRTNWAPSTNWGQTQAQAGLGTTGSQQVWAMKPVIEDTSVHASTPSNQQQTNVNNPATESMTQKYAPQIQQQSQLQSPNLWQVSQQQRLLSQAVSRQYFPHLPEQIQQTYQQQVQNQPQQQELQQKKQQQEQLQYFLFQQHLQSQQAIQADENGQEWSVFSETQNNLERAGHVLQTFSFSSDGTHATLPASPEQQARGEYQLLRPGPLSPFTMYQTSMRQSFPTGQIKPRTGDGNSQSEVQPAASRQTAHNEAASGGSEITDFAFASGKANNVFIAPQSLTIQQFQLSGYRPSSEGNDDDNGFVANTGSMRVHQLVYSLPRDTEVRESTHDGAKHQDGHQHGERASLPKSDPTQLEQAQGTLHSSNIKTIRGLLRMLLSTGNVTSDLKSALKQKTQALSVTADPSVMMRNANLTNEQQNNTTPFHLPPNRLKDAEHTPTTAKELRPQTYGTFTTTQNSPEDESLPVMADDLTTSNVDDKSLSPKRGTETDDDTLSVSAADATDYVDFSRLSFMGQSLQQLINWTRPIWAGMFSSAKGNALQLRFGPLTQGSAADYTTPTAGASGVMMGNGLHYQSAPVSTNIQPLSLFAALGFAPTPQGMAGSSSPFAAAVTGTGFAPVQQGMAGASSPFAAAITGEGQGSTVVGSHLQFGPPAQQPAFATRLSR